VGRGEVVTFSNVDPIPHSVVGDGVGGAIDTPTEDGPVTRVDASDLALENTAAVGEPAPSEADGAWPVVVAVGLGIAVGALATVVLRRRRSPEPVGATDGR
jgi:hypothetical protein